MHKTSKKFSINTGEKASSVGDIYYQQENGRKKKAFEKFNSAFLKTSSCILFICLPLKYEWSQWKCCVGGSSNFRWKKPGLFMFVLLVLMKKSIFVALGMAAFVVPFLSYSYYYLHIPIHPYFFLPWFFSSLHQEVFLNPLWWQNWKEQGFKRNYLGRVGGWEIQHDLAITCSAESQRASWTASKGV